MKLACGALLVLLAVPPAAAPVRYEAQGIRVGGELVVGQALAIKSVDASTLLVSGSAVENLGAPLSVALDPSHDLTLEPGLRLVRQAEGFLLTAHGTSVVLEAAGRVLQGGASVAFTLSPAGYEFAGLGSVDALAVAARSAPASQDGVISPERRAQARAAQRTIALKRRVFTVNPTVASAFADREVLAGLAQLSLDGSN
jgi:hypothetical protein